LCDPAKPFNAASTNTLAALNVAPNDIPMQDQFSPHLSADELTIYYAQYPGIVGSNHAADIFSATRSSPTDPFPGGTALTQIDAQDLEQDPAITSDGLTIFYTTDYLNGAFCAGHGFCIAQASRPTTIAGFADPKLLINNLGDQRFPYAVGSGPTLYYAARNDSTKSWDITSNAGDVPFAVVNGPGVDTSPVVSADELVLYFASDRGRDAGDQLDIWVATRNSKNDPFGTPTRVDALSTSSDDYPGFISADGCRLYLTRDDKEAGGLNLYLASKSN
jgi:Tol biopolymer transport system component